jgi:hypothetical protein
MLIKSPIFSIDTLHALSLLNHGTTRIPKQQAAVGVIMKWKSEEEQELAQSARELQDI